MKVISCCDQMHSMIANDLIEFVIHKAKVSIYLGNNHGRFALKYCPGCREHINFELLIRGTDEKGSA